MKRILFSVLAFAFLMGFSLLHPCLMSTGETYEPVRVIISGPDVAGINEVRTYSVNISGGPAMLGNGNYSYKAVIKAKNTTGTYVTPAEANNTNGHFELNVTMPGEPQRITLEVNATSNRQNETKWVVKEYIIEVVKPYIFKATIKNVGDVDVYGCVVEVFVDDKKITETKIDLQKNSTYTFQYNYTGNIDAPGWHTAKFVIQNAHGVVVFENGTDEITFSFYKNPPPLPKWLPLAVALIVIPVVSIIILLLLGRRKKGSGKKW
jgi:hypothetical protein